MPEDPEQSEKVKISKESEVSEQENFEDLCSEDSFFEQEESEYTIPENIENIKTAKQRKKAFLKMRMICREGRINIEVRRNKKNKFRIKKQPA